MDRIGILLLFLYIFMIYVSLHYIPSNKLSIYNASARLGKISIENSNNFVLNYIQTSKHQPSTAPPYLFIHGHKGSVKQAISMTQYFHKAGIEVNMFSIDFNEGAVGLSYSLLMAEVKFTEDCIKEIAKRYPGTKITLLGHSFGGIVASLALINLDKSLVKGMVTLSTPFALPPVNTDIRFVWEYCRIHQFWKTTEIFLISITGGIRDLTVPPQLTNIKQLGTKYPIHSYSTEINGLHVEIDHIEIVSTEELFEKLAYILKSVNKYSSVKLIKNVKKHFQSEISRMISKQNITADIYIITSKQELQFVDDRIGMKINGFYHYIVPKSYASLLINKFTKVNEALVTVYDENLNFIHMLIGYNIKLNNINNFAIYIKTGISYSDPRYPLNIQTTNSQKINLAYAKCGDEEIIKHNSSEFTFYFHENCENGPEIWLFGVESEDDTNIEIKIDIIGTIVTMIRDFRLHVFTCMFFLSLVYTSSYCFYIQIITAVCFYFFGYYFSTVSYLYLEPNRGQGIKYTVFDIIFIYCAGRGLYNFFDIVFYIFQLISSYIKLNKYIPLIILPIGYFYPWGVSLFLIVSCTNHKKMLYISYLCLLSMLPQHAGWYLAYFFHNIHEVDYQVVPAILLVLAQFYLEEVHTEYEVILVTLIIGVMVNDLLYQVVFILQVLCMWLAFKSFLVFCNKKFLKKKNKAD
jgi:PGAP1-like protein